MTLAVEYECRWNPVWPMPGAQALLRDLQGCGITLGLVSNAQFYSALLFEALLGVSLAGLGFREDLCIWSYEHGVGKPSAILWAKAVDRLAQQDGICPEEILAVGNDVQNDIAPPARLGCRTALFAGDARSLRWGGAGNAVDGTAPHIILTDLSQLHRLLERKDPA
jgi:putative hydrolase of the HAD superfamily